MKLEYFCVCCKKYKSDFYTRKNGKPLSYCVECQNLNKNLKFEEKLENIVEMYGGACYDCNISYPVPIYNFYSQEKVFSISKAKNMSLQNIKKELKGYIMLCKNCCALRKWEIG